MRSIVDVLDDRAARTSDRPIYVFLGPHGNEIDRLTYESFVARTHSIAHALTEVHGFKPGDRVLLAYPPGLEMVVAFFACVRVGLLPVPVSPLQERESAPQWHTMALIATNCSAAGVLTTEAGRAFKARPSGEPPLPDMKWVATDHILSVSQTRVPSVAGEVAFLQYTSGSTSEPKGVIVTHDNLLHNCDAVIGPNEPICVSWLPQHHDMGLIGYYLFVGLKGGTTYGFSPSTFLQRSWLWFEAITRYRATWSSAPNFAFEYCLAPHRITPERLAKIDLSSLQVLMAAAEPIRPDTYNRFLQTFRPRGLDPKSFFVAYGLAENTLAVSQHGRRITSVNKNHLAQRRVRPTRTAAEIAGAVQIMSCGKPIDNVQVEIVDPATGVTLPPGSVGEIWIAGPSVCAGYWGNPNTTAAAFQNKTNGEDSTDYLCSGDLGFVLGDELYVCGRTKDMMIVRGKNIFPNDIETVAIRAERAIREGCAAAFEVDGDIDSRVVLVAEVKPRAKADALAVVKAVRVALQVELSEVLFVRSRQVPRTTSGKVMRFKARERFLESSYTVLARYVREDDDTSLPAAADNRPFAHLLARYHLTGEETLSLLDAGVDSLDLIEFVLELQELLTASGAGALADDVDASLLQQISVTELVKFAVALEATPERAVIEGQQRIAAIRALKLERETRAMREDAKLSICVPAQATALQTPAKTVLLTGATGFHGPFLLNSLLKQTSAKIIAAVRAGDPTEAWNRLETTFSLSNLDASDLGAPGERVEALCYDLERPNLGLEPETWSRLADSLDAIYHNGALVHYLLGYDRMRASNVAGTAEILRLACEGPLKDFNYISTTFIFGWATKLQLLENDANSEMALLDFGYSQSKWVAEQLVAAARARGLPTRIFRPALITPSVAGEGSNFDIAIRLLAFMFRHGIGVTAQNQVSFMPVDVVANNIIAISSLPQTIGQTFHVTRDDYANMKDITDIMSEQTGRRFDLFDLSDFVPEVIRRCTREDLLFPLLDFLVGSIDNISSMEFKRYDNSNYRRARDSTNWGQADCSLNDTVAGILRFMERQRILQV